MLLTKKNSSAGGHVSHVHSTFVHNLKRGLSSALPTMDRRAFLRRSGLGVGVGLAATQLTLVKKSHAAGGKSIVELTCEGLKPNPAGLPPGQPPPTLKTPWPAIQESPSCWGNVPPIPPRPPAFAAIA